MARGRGEGSIAKDEKTGLWVGRIELPSHEIDANGNPKRRRKVVRRKDKNELIRELNKIKRDLEQRGDLHTASQTTGSWFEYWIRDVAPLDRRPSTMNSYRSIVQKHILPKIGRIRLDQLTPTHIRTMLRTMEKEGAAPTYVRNAFSVASSALKSAERDGRIPRNPCDLLDAPRKGIPLLEVLTPEEVIRILRVFQGSPEVYLWATFMLTGARRGEGIGLEWDRIGDNEIDLSWQLQRIIWAHGCGDRPAKGQDAACGYKRAASCPQKRLDLPHDYEVRHIQGGLYWTRPKSSAGWRVIPLVEPLRSWLAEWRTVAPQNPYGLVFSDGMDPIDPDDASRAWPAIRESVGVDRNVRLHDLRHTAIDMMYRAKVNEVDIIRIFGHSTVHTSRSYRSKGNREREQEAMVAFSASLGFPALEQ